MMENLIYDRTEADVFRWAQLLNKGYANMTASERAEWNAGLRGAYTPSVDYNRVETAVAALSAALSAAGYLAPSQIKTNWARSDIPTMADLERYIGNIATIRAALTVLPTTPQTPESMRFLTWTKANDIEKILVDVEAMLQSALLILQYAGQPLFSAGYGVYPSSAGEPLLSEDGQALLSEDGEELLYY